MHWHLPSDLAIDSNFFRTEENEKRGTHTPEACQSCQSEVQDAVLRHRVRGRKLCLGESNEHDLIDLLNRDAGVPYRPTILIVRPEISLAFPPCPSESISPAGCTKKESYKRVVGCVCIHDVILQCFHSLYLLSECYRTQERCCALNLCRTSLGMSNQYMAGQEKDQPGNSGMIITVTARPMKR